MLLLRFCHYSKFFLYAILFYIEGPKDEVRLAAAYYHILCLSAYCRLLYFLVNLELLLELYLIFKIFLIFDGYIILDTYGTAFWFYHALCSF